MSVIIDIYLYSGLSILKICYVCVCNKSFLSVIRSVYASEDLYMSDNELSHDGSDAKDRKKRKRSRSPSPDRKIKNQKKGKDEKKGLTPAGKGEQNVVSIDVMERGRCIKLN